MMSTLSLIMDTVMYNTRFNFQSLQTYYSYTLPLLRLVRPLLYNLRIQVMPCNLERISFRHLSEVSESSFQT